MKEIRSRKEAEMFLERVLFFLASEPEPGLPLTVACITASTLIWMLEPDVNFGEISNHIWAKVELVRRAMNTAASGIPRAQRCDK